MTKDIVTRLLDEVTNGRNAENNADQVMLSAVSEIVRLRRLVGSVRTATTDEGRMPQYHRDVMNRHRREWPTLWKSIDKLLEANT